MKSKFCFIFLIIIPATAWAQPTSYFIKGILEERGTSIRIPFASIVITNTNKGTAADEHGQFIIKVDEKLLGERLKISCIGYITKSIPLDSATNRSSLRIEMTPDVSLLDEVVIKEAPIDPKDIIKEAIVSTKENYLNEPFNMEFYSEIKVTEITTQKEFTLETILFGYSPGYAASKQKVFEITQRRSTGDDPLKALDFPYWPTFEIHNVDQISSSFKGGILNEKHLDKFNTKYSGVSIFDADTVYTIEYDLPKPTEKITGFTNAPKVYKGRIFIATTSHAIVKHEIATDQLEFRIIYKKENGKYFPYFISGDRMPSLTRLLYTIHNTLTLQNIETSNVKVIDYKTNEFQNANLVPFDEHFWNEFYPVMNK